MKQKVLQPQCGTFSRGSETVEGVMLVSNVPSPRGQWWVGGKQRALVAWKPKVKGTQTELYRLVNKVVRANKTTDDVLSILKTYGLVSVRWEAP
jgi:hypothetical protein